MECESVHYVLTVLYSLYECGAVVLTVLIVRRHSQKWLYPFMLAFTIFLSCDYVFEIVNEITVLLDGLSALETVVSVMSAASLHLAFLMVMYSIASSVKYMMILTQQLVTYYIVMCCFGFIAVGVVSYIAILIVQAIIVETEDDSEQYYGNCTVLLLYLMYGCLMLGNILVKRLYESKKYTKRRVYLWTIALYFEFCALCAICDMLMFPAKNCPKLLFQSCANGLNDLLPMFCSYYFMKTAKSTEKRRQCVLLSFTASASLRKRTIDASLPS